MKWKTNEDESLNSIEASPSAADATVHAVARLWSRAPYFLLQFLILVVFKSSSASLPQFLLFPRRTDNTAMQNSQYLHMFFIN
jgi:hypothetical protein